MSAKKKKSGGWLHRLVFLPASIVAIGLILCFAVRYINPASLFFPSLFGLAFPVLLLLGIGLTILYLLFLRWEALLFAGCVLLNYTNTVSLLRGKRSPEPLKSEWMAPDRFKVMSYNVRLFNYYGEIPGEKGSIKSQLLDYVKDQDADIVCMQEYYESKNASFSLGSALPDAGYRHRTRPAANRNFYYGNIIYSKYPILNQGSIEGMNTFDVVFADILIAKDTLRIYNIHLESNRFDKSDLAFFESLRNSSANPSKERKYIDGSKRMLGKMKRATVTRSEQIRQISVHAQTSHAPSRILICGDMNDQPVSYAYGYMRRNGFRDAFIEAGNGFGQSYRGYYPSYRIDYMLYKGNLDVLYFDTRNVDYSDHKPLTAVFSRHIRQAPSA
ncbi:MAG: endonuclease/exonuclease/phosphatase family protein [Bacteroides sp.]|nr:endonuclease/exonuclease/phosphatase family protein [Bacteroides sp.]MCM1085003.1 endonuclease/exonuclease/phosphatase family protein [Bacteroides sp.]